MLGVNFAGGNRAAVSDTERFSLPATGQRDLSANYHDARIPLMCVLGVHPAFELYQWLAIKRGQSSV
jgi:hypothetical protein